MKTIWKFELTPLGVIEMPKGAKVLSAGHQNGQIMIWAKVDDNTTEMKTRYFDIIGTGWDIDFPLGKFINTVFLDNGLVWHIYEAG